MLHLWQHKHRGVMTPTDQLAGYTGGMENIAAVAQEKTGQVLAVEAPAVRAGRP
jgi:hypothetical protein